MSSALALVVVGSGLWLRHAEAGRVRLDVAARELELGTGNASLTGECTEAQHCKYGCADGDCKESDKDKRWDPCNEGWYGIRVGKHEKVAVCDKPCGQACLYAKCKVEDGDCKCPENFYTKDASKRCMEPCGHCAKGCDKYGHCKDATKAGSRKWQPCEPGWYGYVRPDTDVYAVCDKQCAAGCKYGTCDWDGECKCADNFYTKEGGETCGEPCGHCRLGCNKYGFCKEDKKARKWDPCEDGWYGVHEGDFEDSAVCKTQCSANCEVNKCNPYGACVCKDGFYTKEENKPCAEPTG